MSQSSLPTGAISWVVQQAAQEAIQRAPIARGDNASPTPYSVERVLCEQYLIQRADALGIDVVDPRGQRWVQACKRVLLRADNGRADGAYYDGTLRALVSGSPLMEPTQDRADILSGIPELRVAVGAETYALRTAKVSGKARKVTAEATSYSRPSRTLGESGGSLAYYAFEIPDHWLTSMYQNFAGLNVAEMDMMAMRQAFVESEYDVRISGDGPLLGLKQLGLPERTSGTTYTGGTAIATLYSDFIGMVDAAKTSAKAGAAFDTMIIGEAAWYAMDRSTNLGSGGNARAQVEITDALRRKGINRIIVGKSLVDFWGANIDGALLFQSSADFGLMQVRQMNAAPVHTYQSANGTNTVFAMSIGGFECPRLESALLLRLPTA